MPIEGTEAGRHPTTANRFARRVMRQGVPTPTPSARQAEGICSLAPCAAKVACTVRRRVRRVTPVVESCDGLNRRVQSLKTSASIEAVGVCERETGIQRKCWNALLQGKVSASLTRGTSGNLVTRAAWDGSRWRLGTASATYANARRVVEGAGDDGGHASKSTGLG